MSFNLPGEANPFEAPRAGIGEEARYLDMADNDAEMIRREHISHEASVKSIGSLNYLGAILCGFGTVGLALMAVGVFPIAPNQQNGVDPAMQKYIFAGLAAFYLFLTILYGAIGYGLTNLQTWARWTEVVIISLALLYVAFATIGALMVNPVAGLVFLLIGGGINGYILYLLVAPKSGVVFSKEYKEIIRKTPHVKQKMSIIVKILVGILLAIILLAFVGGLIGYFMSR